LVLYGFRNYNNHAIVCNIVFFIELQRTIKFILQLCIVTITHNRCSIAYTAFCWNAIGNSTQNQLKLLLSAT